MKNLPVSQILQFSGDECLRGWRCGVRRMVARTGKENDVGRIPERDGRRRQDRSGEAHVAMARAQPTPHAARARSRTMRAVVLARAAAAARTSATRAGCASQSARRSRGRAEPGDDRLGQPGLDFAVADSAFAVAPLDLGQLIGRGEELVQAE